MKKFIIPNKYKSERIDKIKTFRRNADKMKIDFKPTIEKIGKYEFIISRHFGFCYGVENAIEIVYETIENNKGKNIYLISQIIHNPNVNTDLIENGIKFICDNYGNQLISWDDITKEDIVIIPAFGTTIEIEEILNSKNIEIKKYDTTCPFVTKVWNRSKKLGEENYTVIIHGKSTHEETRATFSHSDKYTKSIIVKDLHESKILGEFILKNDNHDKFNEIFKGKFSENINLESDFNKIGVVNQTTMLASETFEISEFFKNIMIQKFGNDNIKDHFADTRDTLCYATNDNQNATQELLNYDAKFAVVVGGYNSSNTTHLVELLNQKFKTYFIKNHNSITDSQIEYYDIISKTIKSEKINIQEEDKIIVTSGASCPDKIFEEVIIRLSNL